MPETPESSQRVNVSIDPTLYRDIQAAAEHFQLPLDEWIDRALREKLAADPIRPPADSLPGPTRTPYVESGITTRDPRSSAG